MFIRKASSLICSVSHDIDTVFEDVPHIEAYPWGCNGKASSSSNTINSDPIAEAPDSLRCIGGFLFYFDLGVSFRFNLFFRAYMAPALSTSNGRGVFPRQGIGGLRQRCTACGVRELDAPWRRMSNARDGIFRSV